MDEFTMTNIFENFKKTNTNINNILDDIINLDIKIEPDFIEDINEISIKLKEVKKNLKDIYYLILKESPEYISDQNELNALKSIYIDKKITKIFLPYMILMRMKLEHD